MNIAIVSPKNLPIPPYSGYGGTQRGIYDLSMGLAKKGHQIYLIAPLGSKAAHPNLHLITPSTELPSNEYSQFILKSLSNLKAVNSLDIINLRTNQKKIFKELLSLNVPIVYSFHHQVTKLPAHLQNELVTVTVHSESMQKYLSDYPNIRTIHYGIRTEHIKFYSEKERQRDSNLSLVNKVKKLNSEYLLSLGRIDTRKSTRTCIEIAKGAGLSMIVAGNIFASNDTELKRQTEYYEREIVPLIDDRKYFLFGEASEKEKYELMGHAKAFILCSGLEEPFEETFGRVIAESLATGTPVLVSSKSGRAQELIVDGVHGFIFTTAEEAINKLKLIDKIDRNVCHSHALSKLSDQNFIDESELLFKDLFENHKS